jgi:hypothetical protein
MKDYANTEIAQNQAKAMAKIAHNTTTFDDIIGEVAI